MRLASLLVAAFLVGLPAAAQQPNSDAALLAKARALYDSPFTRGLISFDCAIQFDWKQHFVDAQHFINPSQGVTPQAVSAAERLQTLAHRVFVDRSGAVVSSVPNAPDLTGIAHADELERVFGVMVKGGLDSWMPFATNVILPMGPTKYGFEKNRHRLQSCHERRQSVGNSRSKSRSQHCQWQRPPPAGLSVQDGIHVGTRWLSASVHIDRILTK